MLWVWVLSFLKHSKLKTKYPRTYSQCRVCCQKSRESFPNLRNVPGRCAALLLCCQEWCRYTSAAANFKTDSLNLKTEVKAYYFLRNSPGKYLYQRQFNQSNFVCYIGLSNGRALTSEFQEELWMRQVVIFPAEQRNNEIVFIQISSRSVNCLKSYLTCVSKMISLKNFWPSFE